jgi:K+-sensing histidine kinase KdpD
MTATIRKVAADPTPSHPGSPRPRSVANRAARLVAAVVVPVVWALLLIPLRDRLSDSVGLLMVVPVLVAAVAGGLGPGTLAAISGASAFALFHTEPYGLPRIDRASDVVESLVLLAIGLVIGLLVDAVRGARSAAVVRRSELGALGNFLRTFAEGSPEDLVTTARTSIATLLDAESCDWEPGVSSSGLPVLHADGMVRLVDRDPSATVTTVDSSVLPPVLAVSAGSTGRFIVGSTATRRTSLEQRRAAWIVAAAVGRWLDPAART